MFNRGSRIWYLIVFLLAISRFLLNLTNCSAGSLISVSGKFIPSSARLRLVVIYLAGLVYVVWYIFKVLQYLGTMAFSIDNDVANFDEDFGYTKTFDSSGTPSRFPARLETLPFPLLTRRSLIPTRIYARSSEVFLTAVSRKFDLRQRHHGPHSQRRTY